MQMLVSIGPNNGLYVAGSTLMPTPQFILGYIKPILNKFTIHKVTGT